MIGASLETKHTNPIIKEYRIHAETHILKVVAIQIDILEEQFGNVIDLLGTKVYPFLIGE